LIEPVDLVVVRPSHPGRELWGRFNAGPELQHWVYYSLARGFSEREDLGRPAALAAEELSSLVVQIWGPSIPSAPADEPQASSL
jgi:hypothetical protein